MGSGWTTKGSASEPCILRLLLPSSACPPQRFKTSFLCTLSLFPQKISLHHPAHCHVYIRCYEKNIAGAFRKHICFMLRLVYLFWAREAMLRCQEFTLFFKGFFFLMWIIFKNFYLFIAVLDLQASQMALMVKNLPATAGDVRNTGLIPGSGRSLREGKGNILQYSRLENPMDRGAWQATVHRVAKGQRWLKRLSTAHSTGLGLQALL